MNQLTVVFSIATTKDTSDWSHGQRFFDTLIGIDVRLTPQEIGLPDNRKAYKTVESFKPEWGRRVMLKGPLGPAEVLWPVDWQRNTAPRYRGRVDFADRMNNGRWMHATILISSVFDGKVDWLALFRAICELTDAIGGVMYLITPPEESLKTPGISYYCLPIGGTIKDKQLPNIGWATFFGSLFKGEVDADLLRSHGFHVEELAAGYLVLMSETITDVRDNFMTFSKRRAELKKYFRPNLFKITREVGDPPDEA
jgi:hypothetical protein